MTIDEEFVLELRRVFHKWRTRCDTEMRSAGMTLARARTLALLQEEGGIMQRDLLAQLAVEHSTLVRLLDALEAQGLIRREPVSGDRRANHVSLTPAGQPVAREALALLERLRAVALRAIPPDDLHAAVRVLHAISSNLDRGHAAAVPAA
ncbi:MarR family winged helix-turn-helix transcriptional regulator [Roseomonas sp. BN140053]|uniref:MarR family winged helix-turn-helix transcriptional regulator n=1 Tax=Roseomonas sp. BN140053 TaxID=3391898 RepID=UPI0039E87139